MTPTTLFLRSRLVAAIRSLRHDRGSQVALLVGGAFSLVMAYGGIDALSAPMAAWQAAGGAVLNQRLLLFCLATWVGTTFFAVLGVVQAGFGEEARLLLGLPLPPATRLRILYTQVLLEHVATWALLAVVVLGLSLPGSAWPWVLLLLSGLLVTPLLALGALAFFITLFMSTLRAGAGLLLAALLAMALLIGGAVLLRGMPLGLSGLLLSLLALALGPLAPVGGTGYLRAFQAVQRRSRVPSVRLVPGLRLLVLLLATRRSPTAALLLRDVLSRSRSGLTWLRLPLLALYVALVVWLHGRGVLAGASDLLWTVGGSTLLLLLFIIDSQPSPIGSEGARLALLLGAPVSRGQLLWSKWWAFFWPHLLLALVVLIVFGWRFGLGGAAWLAAGVATLLALVGLTTLFSWGSTADIALGSLPEGGIDTFLLEEAPTTFPRLMLANLGVGLVGVVGLSLWFGPPATALLLIAALDIALLVIGWRAAHHFLRRAVR